MASSPELIVFESQEAMAARLAGLVATALDRSIAAQGLATIALSGGSTPAALYAALTDIDIDWANVTASLVDERFVPPTHEASNEGFIRRTLLKGRAASTRLVGLWNAAATLDAAARGAGVSLASVVRPFDVVILGMGVDGHTASWFPDAPDLAAVFGEGAPTILPLRAQRSAVTGAHVERLTMSLTAIREARLLILLMTGEEKRQVFEEARRPGAMEAMPVRAIMAARADLWACWAP